MSRKQIKFEQEMQKAKAMWGRVPQRLKCVLRNKMRGYVDPPRKVEK